ncbi:MAG TPA: alpha-2-macroglobulin family protein, partial [Chloroflexota bacterium]|nr:alpha-2-macroglobulin family protein [Chloroflexota bacterium]
VTVREPATGYSESNSVLVTIAARPVQLQIIPESNTFKPALPFAMLVVAESPDHGPVDTAVDVHLTYQDQSFRTIKTESTRATTRRGITTITLTPPVEATQLFAEATALNADAVPLTLRAGYSPTGSFIHVEQLSAGPFNIGDTARFRVHATREAVNFYYEVLARGSVVYSEFSPNADLAIPITPDLAPEARLLVYQILSNSEVAADFLPFKVSGTYPQQISLTPSTGDAKPGDTLDLAVQTDGPARVGLVAVDRSVFILAENRLNLQQVFDELERLYETPRVEVHPAQPINPITTMLNPGAKETFAEAGVVVLSNRGVPAGVMPPARHLVAADAVREAVVPFAAAQPAPAGAPTAALAPASTASGAAANAGAAPPRVRQFFPETWVWTDLTTDANGRATARLSAPDSITTWALRAVAVSKDKGLGIAEAQLRVFQPFFVELDLPVSAVRGEELPIKVALYNYQATAQNFVVDLGHAGWFDALETTTKSIMVDANGVGGISFQIRPTGIGAGSLTVTARSPLAADAIVKELLVEAEGVAREVVDNLVLSPGASHQLDLQLPVDSVAGSGRSSFVVTGNVLSQTIDGLDGLLRMPFGCGEQNMILFAPDVFVTRYLQSTGQAKPEVLAKAELLLLTGYQRELTYRRTDGSFSAFGDQDQSGSLWLTAFVLKTFSQARGIIYIDDAVLQAAEAWIARWQKPNGSFQSVGFLHHPDLVGGLDGVVALTAYVAIALSETGNVGGAKSAIGYLESQLAALADDYSLAIAAYTLARSKSSQASTAQARLLARARTDPAGLYWGGQAASPTPLPGSPASGAVEAPPLGRPISRPGRSATIETTGYAALALLEMGDLVNAQKAIRWLAAQRNALGGFESTQDTVVALQAMTTAATGQRSDVDATVTIQSGSWRKDLKINPDNADVVQIVEMPPGASASVEAQGKGEVMAQLVRRYNLPNAAAPATSAFQIDVRYSADQVAVNDRLTVTVAIQYTPPEPMQAGMVVLDVAVPTGFAPVTDTLDAAVKQQPKLKRCDLAGRKVILYVDDLAPAEQLLVSFQAQALYPVRAQPVPSRAYAYYHPEWSGETLGKAVVVTATG